VGIISAWKNWRAKHRLERLIQRTGGEQTHREEAEELAERQAAVPVQHMAVKAALRLVDSAHQPDYDVLPNPRQYIDRIQSSWKPTRLCPADAYTRRSGIDRVDWRASEESVVVEIPWSCEVRKGYTFEPRIHGIRYFNQDNFEHGHHLSPLISFFYYRRHLHHSVEPYRPGLQFLGGIQTFLPQFIAFIDDGYEAHEIPNERFAGFETPPSKQYRRRPIRLCLLGEVDAGGDAMMIRRVIVDGKRLALTRENVTLALAYAEQLVGQIFEGKTYDPARAMRATREAQQQTRQPPRLSPS
jgi:hypothetical protein